MMKSFKKLLAVVLSLAMVMGTLTVTAFAAGNVAEVTVGGGTPTEYATLEAALSAVNSAKGDVTIKMLEDATASSATQITQSDYPITFDLNGKTITSTGQFLLLKTTAKTSKGFTINDSSEAGTGKIVSTATQISNGLIYNNVGGDLIINGGTFETAQTGGYLINGSGYKAAHVIVNGGTFKADGAKLVRVNTSNVTINAGLFYGDPATKVESASGTKLITGEVINNQDGTWTVKAADPVCEIVGGSKYMTFDEAVAAANKADTTSTIKLLDDCVKTTTCTTVAATTNITLDLNGKTLTNTATYSDASNFRLRYFSVAGTFTIEDTSAEQTGTIYVNDTYTGKAGGITYANASTGVVYVTGGNFFEGKAQGESTNNCWANTNGGTHQITGGWFAEFGRPTNSTSYLPSGYSTLEVTDESKAATPYTVSNTFKTINYSKNNASATGTVEASKEYYKEGYTIAPVYAKTNQYSLKNYSFMGWSTNPKADPDTDTLVAAGDVIDFSKYTGDTIDFYAIWKEVDQSMWVCVKTGDSSVGYADLAAALASEDDVTLIKNITDRTTLTSEGTINLNGYNIVPTATGSALVIKAAVSIKNFDAGTITVAGTDYKFGGEGKVQGTAQGTGGAIEAGEGATVAIYGGTFTGDAPTHGTVLTCSKTGQFLIYGGTFKPLNAESEVDAYYANNSKIYVLADTQSDVKMAGTFAKNTSGEIGLQGGWFAELQPAAILGSYNDIQGTFTADPNKALVANTGDTTYPYSVSSAWKITYELNGGENDAANPATVAKNETKAITLQPATKEGYSFEGWTDADGNVVTEIKGSDLTADLVLTANFEATVYNITYDNLREGTNTNPTTYTVEDNITLVDAERPTTNYYLSKWTLTDAEGDQVTGWNAGEKTGDITLWANWSGYQAEVNGTRYKTIDDVIEAAKAVEGTATIKLLKGLTLDERKDLRDGECTDFVIDLNGNNITKKTFTNSGLFIYEGNMTIKGEGTVKDDSGNTATSANRSIACQAKDAVLYIEGGTYEKFVKATSNASSNPENAGAGATIVAGTFSFNPSEDATSTLKEGSVFEETEAPFTVYVAAASVTTTEGATTYYKFMYSSTSAKSTVDNIKNGCTVKLYKDASSAHKFSENMTFTLNLNGFKYEKAATESTPVQTLEDLFTAAAGHEIFFATEGDIITVTIKDTVTYAITYDVGNGVNDPANPATYTETTKTFALKDATPNDAAYSFQGWYDDATAGNRISEIAKGTSGDLTLYARYSNTAVATVMVDGVKKNYVSIAAAIAAAIANQKDGVATVTLTGNDLDDTIVVKDAPCKVVFDFDEKDVNAAADKDSASITNSVVEFKNGKIIIYKPICINENALFLANNDLEKGQGFEGSVFFESKGIILSDNTVITYPTLVNQTASAASLSEFGGSLSDSINPEVFFFFAQKAGSTDVPTIKVVSPNGTEILAAEDLGDGKYSAKLTSLTPNQLAEEIEITPMVGDTAIGDTYKTTMLKYLTQLAETEIAKGEGADEKLLNLIADTIKYGSELQKYMKEGTAFDVPSDLSSYVTSGAPEEADSVKATTTSAIDAKNYLIKGASLNIDVMVSTFFVVYSTDSTAKLNITVNGETETFTLSECAVIENMGENFYRVQSKALSALDYSRTITVTLTDSTGTTTYHAMTYSVNSYCYSMSDKVLTSSALTTAIFRYGKSGVEYINNGARYRY